VSPALPGTSGVDKGHVKFQRAVNNPDKRAYLYVLTPTGLKAKSRLTYRFLQNALRFYNDVEARMRQRLMEMAASGVERIWRLS
jgi:hypothetical protein